MVQESEVEGVEFKWGIKGGRGGKKKDVQFYKSFMYDNVEYQLYDSVYMYQESEPEPFIGKIIKIWENSDKTKKVKILWFFRPCEISSYLQDNIASENELFLASGNGAGLANINPLEAIAGKCNAVCISKDERNPHPSKEELEEADFIFYRTFDVGQCVISEKIDDEIAGVDVKLLFNKVSSQKPTVHEFHLDKKDTSEKALHTKETLGLSENRLGESKTVMADVDGCPIDISVKQIMGSDVKQSVVGTPSSPADNKLAEMCKNNHTPERLFDGKSNSTIERKGNAAAEQKSSLGETSIRDDPQKNIATTINSRSKGKEILYSKATMVEPNSFHVKGNGSNIGVEIGKRTNNSGQESSSYEKNTSKSEDYLDASPRDVNIDDIINIEDFGTEDGGKLKKEPLDVDDEPKKKKILKLHHDSCGSEFKPDQLTSASGDKSKRKLANDVNASDNISLKKPKVEGVLTSHVDKKLLKASPREDADGVRKSSSRTFEVTPRPEVEKKNKWFKRLPWKEWIPSAQEQGRLVLLQNLDPSYTSEEIQGIVWHAFGESCCAMPIQHTANSSPYSGLAFVIFKTRQVAEDAIRKLDEVCLLSNGRPLVGSIANLIFPKKQSTFFGHISMDRIKLHMQQEMKEAVSTSHCSQPNNVEYDLAMDWCLLQERSELEWNRLYKRQGRELRDLEGSLKSKRNGVSK